MSPKHLILCQKPLLCILHLPATWKQTYVLQFTTGTHTSSNPTIFNSTASGTFQYNSTPCPSSRQSKKWPNNENPDTPAPKRLQKTLASSTPLLTIPSTNFNANATIKICLPSCSISIFVTALTALTNNPYP